MANSVEEYDTGQLGQLGLPLVSRATVVGPYSFADAEKAHVMRFLHGDVGQSILTKIQSDASVAKLEGKMIATSYGGRTLFDARQIASWWIWRANKVGAEQTDVELAAYLSADEVQVDLVEWLQGIEVEAATEIGGGYEILPAKDYFEVVEKEALLKTDLSSLGIDGPTCSSVLRKKVTVKKAIDSNTKHSEANGRRNEGHELHLAVMLLNCQRGVTANSIYSTSHIHPDTPPFRFNGGGGTIGESKKFLKHSTANLDKSIFEKMLTSAREWDDKRRDYYQTALRRLFSAKTASSPHDYALDLGIALEMMISSGERSEIRFKLATRGAWLLGKDQKHRSQIHSELRRVYDQRSAVAHGGALKFKPKDWNEFRDRKPKQIELAEQVFQKIIIDGTPDWGTLVLGE